MSRKGSLKLFSPTTMQKPAASFNFLEIAFKFDVLDTACRLTNLVRRSNNLKFSPCGIVLAYRNVRISNVKYSLS